MCVRIEQKFCFVETHSVFRNPGTINAVSISLAWSNSGKVTMPNRSIAVRHGISSFDELAVNLIEKAKLNGIGGVAPDRKVGPAIRDSCTKGSWICRKHGGYLAVDRGKRWGFCECD
jgi:hypothetical protein